MPLGSTSITVAVMVPVNVFVALVASFSSNLLEVDPVALSGFVNPNSDGVATDMLPVLLPELAAVLAALVFSLIVMVIMSPTMRARRSSNMGR